MKVTSGSDAEVVRTLTRAASEAEMRPSARRHAVPLASPRSEKVKKLRRPAKLTPRYSCALSAKELMTMLAVIGPLGTLISLWVLPSAPPSVVGASLLRHVTGVGVGSASAGRVIHLSLAGTGRKARYVLPENARWDDFTFGVQERLRLVGMSRIETSAGEAIMSVEDLVHDDTIVIYSEETLPAVRHADATGATTGGLLFANRGAKLLPDALGPALPVPAKAPSLPLPSDALWRRRKTRGGSGSGTLGGNGDGDGGAAADGQTATTLMPRLFEKTRAMRQQRQGGGGGTDAAGDGGAGASSAAREAGQGGGYAAEAAALGVPELEGADPADEEAHAQEIEEVRLRQRERQQRFEEQNVDSHRGKDEHGAVAHFGHDDPSMPTPEAEALSTDGEPCGERHPDFRLALLVSWVGPLPLWTPYFVSSARLSAPLADFLIYHEVRENKRVR